MAFGKVGLLAVFAAALSLLNPVDATAAPRQIIIGTGGVMGVYYPAGGSICRLVNRDTTQNNIRCSVEVSDGSIANIKAMRAGDIAFAIVQSDWQYHAYYGSDRFAKDGAFSELRSIFSLHSEPFSVIARQDSHIEKFQDLKGKRLNIGNIGSGQRSTMEVVMNAFGWKETDFAKLTDLPPADQSRALCENEVDAIVYTVGHPNSSIKDASFSCDSHLISVTGREIERLIRDNIFYSKVTIPGGIYRGTSEPVQTFGVNATLVTTSKTADDIVYNIVKAVFENFPAFTKLHPALASLDPQKMIRDGLSAPLHPGALKYYREVGLIE